MFKERNSGLQLFHVPAVDFSVIAVMFLLVVLAWGVARMEKTFVKTEKYVPEFSVSQELSVSPVIEPKMKKEAAKVGKFMTLAKTSMKPLAKPSAAENANADVLKNIVLSRTTPVGATVLPPRIIYKSIPDYPAKAIEAGMQGVVMVKIYILKNGRVGEAFIDRSSGFEILDRSAVAAISQWIFEPAVYSKEPTEAWFKIPVKFQLKT